MPAWRLITELCPQIDVGCHFWKGLPEEIKYQETKRGSCFSSGHRMLDLEPHSAARVFVLFSFFSVIRFCFMCTGVWLARTSVWECRTSWNRSYMEC